MHTRDQQTSRQTRRRVGGAGLVLVVVALLAALLAALPESAGAVDRLELTSSGNQNAGRWQVFDVPTSLGTNVSAEIRWSGGGDVNVFLKAADGTDLAFDNAVQTSGPVWLRHTGRRRVARVAVLVKSGSADYTVRLREIARMPAPPAPNKDYPGQPDGNSIYFGASQTGNGDPSQRLERRGTLGIRRTFFQWDQRTSWMISVARSDHRAGRLPWVSVKPPSWRGMAAGRHDNEIDQMLRALARLDAPVWLTVAHEPEGGDGVDEPDQPGGPAAHVDMNRRVRSRMTALGIDNVALVPVFMTWTWDPRSGRNPDEWWDDGIYDLLGTDLYDRDGTGLPLPTDAWARQRRWAEQRGVDMAVAEYGLSGNGDDAARRLVEWHKAVLRTATDGRGARVVAMSVYDNDYQDWRMSGAKLDQFRRLVPHPRHTLW